MRGADGGPWRRLCALPAFWVITSISLPCFSSYTGRCFDTFFKPQVGLLYDEDVLQAVLDLIADWTPAEREMLRNKVKPIQATFTFS